MCSSDLVVDSTAAVIAAVALMQLRSGLDALDGQIARLRGASSRLGAWLDKVSDTVGWGALFAATAFCAGRQVGSAWAVLVPLAAAIALSFQGVTYWLDKRSGGSPSSAPAAEMPFLGKLLSVLRRIPMFEEPDYYLWFSIALLLDDYPWLLAFTTVAFAARVAGFGFARTRRAARFGMAHAG